MDLPTFDAPAEEAPAMATTDGGSGPATAESPYTKLVPQNLRERSAAALAKWQAGQ